MPNRSASRASGFINPADGLTFSGAVAAQSSAPTAGEVAQVTAAKTNAAGTAPVAAPATANAFVAAGLAATGSDAIRAEQGGFSAGLQGASADTLATTGAVASSLTAEDDETAPSPPAAPTGCDTTVSPLYCVYEVKEGDTLGTIADMAGLKSTEEVANWEFLVHSNKPEIIDEFQPLQIGQKIRVPYGNGAIHFVLGGQTLSEIASIYGVTVEQIIAVNGMGDADSISVGLELLIPNPTSFAPIFVPDEVIEDDEESEDGSGDSSGGIVGGGSRSASGFIWPVAGPLSSSYGPGHPLGIDIDLFNSRGAPIAAAMGGVVTFAGGNACCSYGLYVVIDHGNGLTTLYAHLSSIGVSVGEVVAQGEYIGNGGTTGYSTGDHLHFEVHSGGAVVNPLNYLP